MAQRRLFSANKLLDPVIPLLIKRFQGDMFGMLVAYGMIDGMVGNQLEVL